MGQEQPLLEFRELVKYLHGLVKCSSFFASLEDGSGPVKSRLRGSIFLAVGAYLACPLEQDLVLCR
jgi:hypothetical protein